MNSLLRRIQNASLVSYPSSSLPCEHTDPSMVDMQYKPSYDFLPSFSPLQGASHLVTKTSPSLKPSDLPSALITISLSHHHLLLHLKFT